MNTIITLNGRDGIGKTEQMRLLRDQPEIHVTQVLKHYSTRWPKLKGAEDFDWWFEKTNFNDFIGVITESLNKRNLDRSLKKIIVHERGTLMFLAVCMASLATRRQTNISQVQAEVEQRFISLLDYSPGMETNILLVEDQKYKDSIKRLESWIETEKIPYTPRQQKIYQQYQKNLQVALDICFQKNTELIMVNQSIIDVQNRIRQALSTLGGIKLEDLCGNITSLVCLGGMSESGKSLLGQNLHTLHGSYRLKLKYFAGAFGDDFALAHEVVRFLHMHRHITLASVESLHNPGLSIAFKKLFGTRAKIVFLDAPQGERSKRHMSLPDATMEEFLQKEALKESRGAHKIKPLADLVIDTSIDMPDVTCQRTFEYQ